MTLLTAAGGGVDAGAAAAIAHVEEPSHGEAVQADPIEPKLKAPGTNLLTLRYDELLSIFAFKVNLRRYTTVVPMKESEKLEIALLTAEASVGRFTLSNLHRC